MMKDERWWLGSAVLVAALMIALGVGNLIEDDGGPLYGKVIFAAVLIGGAALVGGGILVRRGDPNRGSRMVGIGVLPGALGIALFWFPPALAVGVLALITAVHAFRNSERVASGVQWSFYGLTVAALAVTFSGAWF